MKTIVIVMLMVFGVIVTNQQLEANQKKESAFDIKKFELVKSEKQIKLNFDLKSKVDGDINYFIHAPKEMEIETKQYSMKLVSMFLKTGG